MAKVTEVGARLNSYRDHIVTRRDGRKSEIGEVLYFVGVPDGI